jgi:hypothetical protein
MPYPSTQPIVITASATLNRNTHANNVLNLSAAAGLTITLPASAGTGDMYRFFVLTTVTSNNDIIKVANSTDVIQGTVDMGSSGTVVGIVAGTTTTSDTITMNGTTTGGIIGSYIELTDASTGFWQLSGGLVFSGTVATPFSATV